MTGLLATIKACRRRRLYQALLQDRIHLTDYEREQLIPEIRSRLEVLKEYVIGIITICKNLRDTPLFAQNLESIINPHALESPMGDAQSLAQRYFDEVEAQAQKEYVDDIDDILKKYENITDFQTLGLFLNEVNFLCSSIIAVKTNLFLLRIQGYPVIVNRNTGETIAAKPDHYDLTTQPFQVTIQNLESVARATSESIHHWHEQTVVTKGCIPKVSGIDGSMFYAALGSC